MSLRHLLRWTELLTGLDPDRVQRSIAVISGWCVRALPVRLTTPRSVDDAVRAVLLAEAVDLLSARGVPMTKLLSKLRDVGQFEATWAELRCAALMASNADGDVGIELEPGRSAGSQPDVRLVLPEGPPHTSVEIKAVGLSDAEVAFLKRMSPALDTVIPPFGMATFHTTLDGARPRLSAEQVARLRLDAARSAAGTPGYPPGLSAVAIVAHGNEPQYVRRAADRITRAIKQLPRRDESWVALHWSNGAPVDDVVDALDWSALPAHVAGIVFVGSVVVFPHRDINNFQVMAARGYQRGARTEVQSAVDDDFAATVLERTEQASGVRATLLRGITAGKRSQLLRRDGTERIAPFNLILDRDPVSLR